MPIPGSNLLKMALRVIASQSFRYYAFSTRTLVGNGNWVSQYALPVTARGSIQPVPRSMYEQLGLDWQKNYVNVFVPQDVVDVSRNVGSDYIVYGSVTSSAPTIIATEDGFGIATESGQPIITEQSNPAATKMAKYHCISSTKWYLQDGWTQVLCVQVGGVNA